jgi:hypothetical protein
MCYSGWAPEPPRGRRLPQPLRLELNPGKRPRQGSNPRVVARRRPAPQLQVCTHEITISRISQSSPTSRELCMICLKIPGEHGACGHEAIEGSRVRIGRAAHGGEPREICVEGGDCGKGAESDAGEGCVRGLDNKLYRPSNATNLLNQEKKEKGVTVVTLATDT